METMILKGNELSQLQNLGGGACATVYKFSDDLALKIFKEKGIELHDEETFSKLVGVENETCIFPKCRVKIDGQFQGYAMQYVNGSMLADTIKNIDLKTLIEAIQEAEKDLRLLATDKILINDLNQGGLMWSNEGKIKVIDTDFFQKNEDITEEQAYSHNLESFNSMIEMELGILSGQTNILIDFLQSNAEYNKLYMDYMLSSLKGDNMSVTELLSKALELFKNEFGIVAHSIEDMETILKEKNLGIQQKVETDIPVFEPPIDMEEPMKEEFEISHDKLKLLNNCINENLKNRKNSTDYSLLYNISIMMTNGFKIKDRYTDEITKPLSMEETKEIALQFFKELDQKAYEKVKGIVEGNSEFSFSMYMLDEKEDFSKTDNDGMPIYTKIPSVVSKNGKSGVYVPCKGTIEDIYMLVHELSHTLDFVKQDNPTRNILGEVTPYCFEAMLSQYLLENGIATRADVINREKAATISHYDDGVETFAKFKLMKIKEENGDITQEDIRQLQKNYGLTNNQLGYVLDRMENSVSNIDYKARYMIAQLIYPYYMKQYEQNPQNAIKTLKEYFEQIKSNNFIGSLQTLGIEPRVESIQKLIEIANSRFENLENTKQFSIQELGKGTLNVPTKIKDEARKQTIRDAKQIEQMEVKKHEKG